MTLEPAIVVRLVGAEVVENDVDGGVRVVSDDTVHKIEEFDAPPAIFVGGSDLASGHLEGRKQGRSAVALVVVTMTGQSPAIRQFQIPLGALQRLDRGFFVDTDHDRVLRGRHVEPHHIGGLGDELKIIALAPGFAPREVDLLGTQDAPDLLSCTSPNSAAISLPVQRANPAGGGRSNTARIRLPVSALYFGTEPGRGLSTRPASPSRLNRPRHRLTVRGIVSTARAIDRVERPSAANKMIRARKTSRCSVVGARTRASSTARSSGVNRTSAALGIIPMLNHESAFGETGY